MAISLRAAGTATSSTAAVTAVDPAVPTGTTTGDISVLAVWVKPYNATITTPSGWTKIDEHTNGTTAGGTDTGSMKIALYVLESATPGAIGNIGQTSANSMGAVIHSYQKAAGETWDYSTYTTGGDSTNGTNFSATGAAGISIAAGDWAIAATAVCGDIGTVSAQQIGGMSGATMGTVANRTNAAVTTGLDSRGLYSDRACTAGSSSAAPTYTYTNSSSTSGATMWLRLRVLKAKTETLTDDFASDDRATKWPNSYGSTAVSGGVATVTATGGADYAGLQSASNAYTLVESHAKVKMTMPSGGYAALTVTNANAGDDLCSYWTGGTLSMGIRTGYSHSAPGTVAVSAGGTIYVGIGEGVAGAAHFGGTGTAGNSYWFTSTDGTTWTQRKTAATPSYANSVTILLESGEAAATTTFDDYNVSSGSPGNVAAVTATATATGLAPAVTAAASVTAPCATATAAAMAPAVGVPASVTAPTATATATGAVPAVTAAAVVPAVRAQATATAPAPSVTAAATVTAPTATATAASLAPAVSAGGAGQISAVTATATATAAAPAVTSASNITGTSGTATAGMQVPAVAAAATVGHVRATATAQAYAPTVTATANGQVNPPAATVTATALAPELHLSAVVLAPTATATVQGVPPTVTALRAATVAVPLLQATTIAFAPVVTLGVTITAPLATATGTMPAPVVTSAGSGNVNAVRAQATAAAPAPVVTAAAVVAAVRATATALAHIPAVTGEVLLEAPHAQATGLLRIPVVTAGAVVQVPTATVLARPYAPHVLTIDMSDVVLFGRPLVRRWLPVGLRDTYEAEGLADRFTGTYVPVSPKYDTQEIPDRFVGGLVEGETMSVDVLVSAGAVKYVGGTVTETAGLDISGASFEMSLGSATDPGTTWVEPDVSAAGTSNAQRVLKLLVSSTLPAGITWPGTYWCWARITASPEIEPVRLQGPIVVR